MAAEYRFSQALIARAGGAVLLGVGLVAVLVSALRGLLGWSWSLLWLVVPLIVVVLAVNVAVVVFRRVALVRFDGDGYRVRLLRGAGVRQARWRDVEDVVTATVSGHDCVVVRLRDGRTTSVPVAVLDVPRETFVRDLRTHLDAGHGYRRIR